jgi:hypothetical protein
MMNVYPNEYREGAMLMTTKLLLAGGNPYALAQQPQYTNVYGIFYPLVTAPLAFFMGVSLPVHRIVSAVFMLGSAGILYLVMERLKVSFFYRMAALGIFYGHSIYSCSYAYPNGLGLFLLLITIFVPWWYEYGKVSLIISIMAGILGFLTKPYFVLGIPYLFVYLFFTQRSMAVKYALTTIISFLGVMAIVIWQFPLYIYNTLLIHNNVAGNNINYMLAQLQTYARDNILLIILGLFILWHQRKNISNSLVKSFDLVNTCLGLSLLLFITKLGLHEGAWISYLHHLVSPFAIVSLFTIFSNHDRLQGKNKPYQLVSYLLILIAVGQLRSPSFLPDISPKIYENWAAIDRIISNHQKVLSVPVVAPILLAQNKEVWDNGESEYFIDGIDPQRDPQLKQQDDNYRQTIKNKILNREYDLVVANSGIYTGRFIDSKALNTSYRKINNIKLSHGFIKESWRHWEVDLYVPKQ